MKQSEIEQLLPEILQRTIRPGNPLLAILEVMEVLQAPAEEVLEQLDTFFDPYRTPDNFVPYLARWVVLEHLLGEAPEQSSSTSSPAFPSGLGRLRELIAAAASLSQWRGTGRGLLRFLETATGIQGFTINEQVTGPQGQPKPFHIQIQAPAGAQAYRGLIERIIETEKPAYVTYELKFTS